MNETPSAQPYYLLREYRPRLGGDTRDAASLTDAYIKDALLPAAKRLGLGPAGVFTTFIGEQNFNIRFVLMKGTSLKTLADLDSCLLNDREYIAQSQAFRDDATVSVKSNLIKGLEGLPALQLPAEFVGAPGRLFELRHYEQPTDSAHRAKAKMFQDGEAAVLDGCGFHGVMYGVNVLGERQQHVTYMWVYQDLEDRRNAELKFFSDPDARAFMARPEYAIQSVFSCQILRPLPYSEV